MDIFWGEENDFLVTYFFARGSVFIVTVIPYATGG